MQASAWRDKIRRQIQATGTYRPAFCSVVDALAKVLEQRDAAYQQFIAEGSQFVVERVSDRGAINRAKNPLLQTWMDLNSQALSYWGQLGLTPAGLKKIDEEAMKPRKQDALAKVLSDLV
mgnify:CR=1 FL=1